MGPRGRTAILDSDYGAPQIVNSGVVVAKSIELEDRFEKQAAVLENALILLCDQKVSSINDMVPLLEAAAKSSAPLLLIAKDVEADALATPVVNSVRRVVKTCAVKASWAADGQYKPASAAPRGAGRSRPLHPPARRGRRRGA